MDIQKIVPPTKEHRQPWHHGAHSGTRSGIEDYNDGGSFTHYLGNDDFIDLYDEGRTNNETQELNGHEAFGNEVQEEDIDFKSNEKRHSGL